MEMNRWYKVDNVSKVFLAANDERDTKTLRISATLTEKVDPEVLQTAVNQVIATRPMFQYHIKKGLFWHYMEPTGEIPQVKPETERPCPVLYGMHHKGKLHVSITYYEKRINFEAFHVLCDGTGAIEFLNTLVLKYLMLQHPELESVNVSNEGAADELSENSFEKYYEKKPQAVKGLKRAYHVRGPKLPYSQLQFVEVRLKSAPIKQLAKQYGVSVSSVLGARMMMALYQDMPTLKRHMPITVTMPVNLRNYYPSKTSRNFFNNISVSHVLTGTETEEELAIIYDKKMKHELEPEIIKGQMDSYQKFEKDLYVRLVPLDIKQLVLKLATKMETKKTSAVISNLGVVKLPEAMAQYIEHYCAYCSYDELFLTVTSFKDEIILGITNAFANTSVVKTFVKSFATEDNIPIIGATEVTGL